MPESMESALSLRASSFRVLQLLSQRRSSVALIHMDARECFPWLSEGHSVLGGTYLVGWTGGGWRSADRAGEKFDLVVRFSRSPSEWSGLGMHGRSWARALRMLGLYRVPRPHQPHQHQQPPSSRRRVFVHNLWAVRRSARLFVDGCSASFNMHSAVVYALTCARESLTCPVVTYYHAISRFCLPPPSVNSASLIILSVVYLFSQCPKHAALAPLYFLPFRLPTMRRQRSPRSLNVVLNVAAAPYVLGV
jgi:hypothetical protein